jgi:hypothetical protein
MAANAAGAAAFTAIFPIMSWAAAVTTPLPDGRPPPGLASALEGFPGWLPGTVLVWAIFSAVAFAAAAPLTVLASPALYVLVRKRVPAAAAIASAAALSLLFLAMATGTKGNGIAELARSDEWTAKAGYPIGFAVACVLSGGAYGWALWAVAIGPYRKRT